MYDQQQLVNLSQMARLLRVQTGWLRREAEARRVPCLQAGSRFFFHPPAVEEAIIDRASMGNRTDVGPLGSTEAMA